MYKNNILNTYDSRIKYYYVYKKLPTNLTNRSVLKLNIKKKNPEYADKFIVNGISFRLICNIVDSHIKYCENQIISNIINKFNNNYVFKNMQMYLPGVNNIYKFYNIARYLSQNHKYCLKLDIQNAYYSVDFNILLYEILPKFNFNNFEINRIKNFYFNIKNIINHEKLYLYYGLKLSNYLFTIYLYNSLNIYMNKYKYINLVVYVDDIFIFSDNDRYLKNSISVLSNILANDNLYINPNKTEFTNMQTQDLFILNKLISINRNNIITNELKNYVYSSKFINYI
ncbi:hypothetical protein AHEV_013 [Adoxophyes honmai entomopoxvirus 'L']|uniref:Reverse transcriptase domain-containing protein n=1 Tax=Adoxophyes honmai entomopoxvirus 'L' TaxID=1293540 RepID=A0A916P0Q3_9POXV|nr:hypothetical protein AHEV_013 [Adoxophyes honmai entomopoxvirus 'L']CCU55334.1 hypothetical protein AHEV_013 [Adoxophyes honmai entomopoxvirus 'L']